MKSAMNLQSNGKTLAILFTLVLLTLAGLALSGCGTVTPPQVQSASPSWDGTIRNSGFIGWTTNGEGILTTHARARYNSLIESYGSRFHPPLVTDYGVRPATNGTYIFTPEAIADFATMNRWRRNENK